jgi:hypothetical protein
LFVESETGAQKKGVNFKLSTLQMREDAVVLVS